MVGSGSGKFDRIRIREKGPDSTGSGSATLVPVHHGVQLFDFSMRNKKMSTAGTIKKNPSG